LLVSEPTGVENLLREGHSKDRIALVGNVMIDTLLRMLPRARELEESTKYGLRPGEYGVVTLHRPPNVDNVSTLERIVDVLIEAASSIPLIFPVHPRTRETLAREGLQQRMETARDLHVVGPLGYLQFLSLNANARLIITDSGGLQEESTVLGVPCLTLRANTERPVTVEMGTSTLIGDDTDLLRDCIKAVLQGTYKSGACPDFWDGRASERIAAELLTNSQA
jgi:UDP-N-acetylglucosamine 2-epimerase (non-hydrolysing)